MKYHPKTYARAFTELIEGLIKRNKSDKLIKGFLDLIVRNGDFGKIEKIFEETEKKIREKLKIRKINIEIARPVKNLYPMLDKLIKKQDSVIEKIDAKLIAGIKIIINDEIQYDGTLKRKLNEMFN